MKKDERQTYIRLHAYELARTGNYIDWLSVERALIDEGWTEARSILDRSYIREELNEICKNAQLTK